jgi:hypothetical protein
MNNSVGEDGQVDGAGKGSFGSDMQTVDFFAARANWLLNS